MLMTLGKVSAARAPPDAHLPPTSAGLSDEKVEEGRDGVVVGK